MRCIAVKGVVLRLLLDTLSMVSATFLLSHAGFWAGAGGEGVATGGLLPSLPFSIINVFWTEILRNGKAIALSSTAFLVLGIAARRHVQVDRKRQRDISHTQLFRDL